MSSFTDVFWTAFYTTQWIGSLCVISTFILRIRELVLVRQAESTEVGGEQVECSDTANTGYVPLSLVRIYIS